MLALVAALALADPASEAKGSVEPPVPASIELGGEPVAVTIDAKAWDARVPIVAGRATFRSGPVVWNADEDEGGIAIIVRNQGDSFARVAIQDVWGTPQLLRCAPDGLVIAAFRSGGTAFLDPVTAEVKARTHDGHAGNARWTGPACSPDGRWVALPTPYAGHVGVYDSRTGAHAVSVPAPGAGSVEWTKAGLRIATYPLPYE